MTDQKAYFDELNAKLDRVIMAMVTQEDLAKIRTEMREGFRELRESVTALTNSVDKLLKRFADLEIEYAATKMQMDRYDRWFKQIAEKTGVELK